MAFVNEIPTEEEIVKYGLPYANDKNWPPERRRIWTVDHDRNFHLTGDIHGDQARGEEVKWLFKLYLNGVWLRIYMKFSGGSSVYTDNPYVVQYGPIESIWVIRTDIDQSIELSKSAWQQPDSSQSLLGGRTLNEVVDILKEGLTARKAGQSNRNINNPIVVQFNF